MDYGFCGSRLDVVFLLCGWSTCVLEASTGPVSRRGSPALPGPLCPPEPRCLKGVSLSPLQKACQESDGGWLPLPWGFFRGLVPMQLNLITYLGS